ncbi:hypothetical protein C9374_001158 [Naegleria lovaniensis]|uniref:F-box domain-containing protein n=1 Tax=Naegleria lovaniensis TaxID=51637 RepID=A0AA88KN33_NAELO|nr:uncharacterized protein C9374_001158 [Naegleria lovaniensis]KAG2387564.1 hypothetical protein C9374_001158 [Naegleria lovaniensis]
MGNRAAKSPVICDEFDDQGEATIPSSFHWLVPPDLCFYNIFCYLHFNELIMTIPKVCSPWRRALINNLNVLHLYPDVQQYIDQLNNSETKDSKTNFHNKNCNFQMNVFKDFFPYVRYVMNFVKSNQMKIEHVFVNGSINNVMFLTFSKRTKDQKNDIFKSRAAIEKQIYHNTIGPYYFNCFTEPEFLYFYYSTHEVKGDCFMQSFVSTRPEIFHDLYLDCEFTKNVKNFVFKRLIFGYNEDGYLHALFFPKSTTMVMEEVQNIEHSYMDPCKFAFIKSLTRSDCVNVKSSSERVTLSNVPFLPNLFLQSKHVGLRQMTPVQVQAGLGLLRSNDRPSTKPLFTEASSKIPKVSKFSFRALDCFRYGVADFLLAFKSSLTFVNLDGVTYSYVNTLIERLEQLELLKHLRLGFYKNGTSQQHFTDLMKCMTSLFRKRIPLENLKLCSMDDIEENALLEFVQSVRETSWKSVARIEFENFGKISHATMKAIQDYHLNLTITDFIHSPDLVDQIQFPTVDYDDGSHPQTRLEQRLNFSNFTQQQLTSCLSCRMVLPLHQHEKHCQLHHHPRELDYYRRLEKTIDLINYEIVCPACEETMKRCEFEKHVEHACSRTKFFFYNGHSRCALVYTKSKHPPPYDRNKKHDHEEL